MPGWIVDIQGYREILDAAGDPVQRRKTLQVIGATVTDDGAVTVIEVPPGATGVAGATGATGPSGDTHRTQFVLVEDFMAVAPARTTSGLFQGDRAPWTFAVLGGTASVAQGTTFRANHPGQALFATGPTTGEWSAVLGDSDLITTFAAFGSFGATYRVSSTFANTIVSFGMASVANTPDTAATAAFFHMDPAVNANFRARTRDGGVQTSDVDTGVAIAAGTYYTFRIDRDPATDTLFFYINENLVATTTLATHSIDAADELKLAVYCKNNGAGVSNPVFDLIEYSSLATLDRTVP